MAPRRQTPLGWVGFDGGLKRAISFARRKREEEEDDDRTQPRRRPCVEDGTLLDLTLTGITICGCAVFVGGATIIYNVVSDPNDLLGVWEDIPLGTPTVLTPPTPVLVMVYSDACVTEDSGPFEAEVRAFITCADGLYTVSVVLECLTDDGTILIELFQATGELDTTLPNIVECVGSTTFNVPFTIDSAELALAA